MADSGNGLLIFRVSWRGDFEPDGDVDFANLIEFISHCLDMDCIKPYSCEGTDLDNNTKADFSDFAIFADNWLIGAAP